MNPIKHLWRDLKIAVQQRSPSNLTELERICREQWENLPKYRRAKLVASYPCMTLQCCRNAVIAVKGASTKYWVKGLNTYVNVIFQFFYLYKLANISKKKNCFCFVIMGYCNVIIGYCDVIMGYCDVIMGYCDDIMVNCYVIIVYS